MKIEYVRDVEMSLTSFYFKMVNGKVYKLEHNNSENYKFANAVKIDPDLFDYTQIQSKKIQNYVKLYSGF